jgi:hypothetical protein
MRGLSVKFVSRMLVGAMIAAAVLMFPMGRVSAAGISTHLPVPAPHAGDYYFYAETCSGTVAAGVNCGFVYATKSTPGSGQPESAYFGCINYGPNETTAREGYVIANYSGGEFGTGTIVGSVGVTGSYPTFNVATFLFGTSHPVYYGFTETPVSGTTAGFALGSATVNDAQERVTGGKITITVSGTLVTASEFGPTSTTQGSLSCAVAPTTTFENRAYASPDYLP